jgi:peptide/nickel transport system permease protein
MLAYTVKRLGGLVPVLLGVSFLVFVMIHLIPGDVAQILLGVEANEQNTTVLREKFGLDKPVLEQYATWLGQAAQGNLGESFRSGKAIAPDVAKRVVVTLEVTVAATVVGWLIGIPLGIVAAVRQESFLDLGVRVIALLGVSIPGFALGTVLLLVLSLGFKWFPPVGYVHIWDDPLQALTSLALPAVTMGFGLAGSLMRMTRSSVLEVLRQDYIRTARSKGLSEKRVIFRHALRNAAIPIITVAGLQTGYLLGGSVITEELFSLPGLGRLTLTAINQRDYPVVQACILVIASAFVLVNLVTDLSYAAFDPRIQYQ